VEVAGLGELVAAMAALTVQNGEIMKTLSQRKL
jgi:hypothetical protein